MKTFASLDEIEPVERHNEHAGKGPIFFRRIFDDTEFRSAIDFIDYTVIPAGSSIGRHAHRGNEEFYFIAAGAPLMRVNEEERRLRPGSFAVVREGGSHELVNDTSSDVEILVVQVAQR